MLQNHSVRRFIAGCKWQPLLLWLVTVLPHCCAAIDGRAHLPVCCVVFLTPTRHSCQGRPCTCSLFHIAAVVILLFLLKT